MCVLALYVVTGVSVNAATDGEFFESIRTFLGMPKQQKQVADEGIKLGRSDSNVYADPLVTCSDAYIVFANERGLMIYGRDEETLLAALDLQAIDCNYFNAETVETHVMMQKNLCRGYLVSPKKFIDAGRGYEKIRKELVEMYVADIDLDVKYFKDYGWDPIPLDNKPNNRKH